jgi:peptide/nickel transport system substrate-binding protein
MADFARRFQNVCLKTKGAWVWLYKALSDSGRGAADLNRQLVARMSRRSIPSWRQLKYFASVLNKTELRILRAAIGVLVFSILALLAVTYRGHIVSVPAPGGEYVEAVVGSPSIINPLIVVQSDVDADLTRLLYSGLVSLTPDGKIVPDLAESYETSEDGTEYTFKLKDRLYWHDGEKVTIDDVLFTFSIVQNPDYRSPYYQLFQGVSVERKDDDTVRFMLEKPRSSFLSSLSIGILPAHVWQDVPPSAFTLADFNLKPIGAGPYRFKSLVRDRLGAVRSYTLERFKDSATPALLDRIIFHFYPDMEGAALAVSTRQADGIAFVPLEYRDKIESRHDLANYKIRLPQYTAVFFNPKKSSLLKDDAVRRALLLAAPRQKIVTEILHREAFLAEGPILSGLPGHDSGLKQADEDGEAAKAALEKAGYVYKTPTSTARELQKTKKITIGSGRGASNKTVADGQPIPLAIKLTTVDRKEFLAVANTIAEAWKSVGASVEIKVVAAFEVKDLLKNKDYEALLYSEVIGADLDPYPYWHSSETGENGYNLALYANRTVDDALEEARRATSSEARAALYSTVGRKIASDTPAIFLYSSSYSYYLDKAIKGVVADMVITPADRLAGIRDWYKKMRRAWR